eukprot:320493-Pelagomonas_calceolata.AAC.2
MHAAAPYAPVHKLGHAYFPPAAVFARLGQQDAPHSQCFRGVHATTLASKAWQSIIPTKGLLLL